MMKFRQRFMILAFTGVFSVIVIIVINVTLFSNNSDKREFLHGLPFKKSVGSRLFSHSSAGGHLNIMRKDLDTSNFVEDSGNRISDGIISNMEKNADGHGQIYIRFVTSLPTEDVFENSQRTHYIPRHSSLQKDRVLDLQLDRHFHNYHQMTEDVIRKKIATYRKKARHGGKKLNVISLEELGRDVSTLTSWEKFYLGISQYEIYREDDSAVDELIQEMATLSIIDAVQKKGGTQIKLIISFSNDGQALFKPKRHGRKYVTNPNHFYFSDFERHTSEIASFHLDRILGNRWVPPVAGRIVNASREIRRVCDSKLLKTFFISPAGNLCFYGKCTYYCDTAHAVCAKRDMLEGSLMAFLPPDGLVPRSEWENPWRRSYSKWKKADWELDPQYCTKFVLTDDMYSLQSKTKRKRILDVMDMTIFDFLTGNMDRHHYNTLEIFDNDTTPFLWDNGRGFGKPDHDELSIIVPIEQCCVVRHSTLQKLVLLHTGPIRLSQLMRTSLSRDAINADPILPENHLRALDRRVGIILKVIHTCSVEKGVRRVVIDDGF